MKKKKVKTISRIINILSIIIVIFLLYKIYSSDMIPTKYLVLATTVLVILEVIYTTLCWHKKTKNFLLIIFDVFAVIFMIVELFAALKLGEAMAFLSKNLSLEYTTDTYYIIVNKDSDYEKIKDIEDEDVYYFDSTVNRDKLKSEIDKKVSIFLAKEKDYNTLLGNILKDTDYIIVLHSSNYESLIDLNEEYRDTLKVLFKVDLKNKVKKKETKNNEHLLKKPFLVYLSGIDTRSNAMPQRSLSDVNMIIAVNPNTNKILLVSTPRDYYVQIHGTTGLKDKLTHAGMMGGVELSKATIEDLYGIQFNYYIRVNFNAVINLVDAVGGITLNSDVDYSFSCWTDRSCVFKPGNNNVNGKCALAFARERHAYATGDRHRGENQQQVIGVLLNKLTSPGSILSNYSTILKSLEGTFETSFSEKDVTNIINYQLDKMPSWKVESISVDGTGTMKETYSYPTMPLSVMLPDLTTVEAAKVKINEIIQE